MIQKLLLDTNPLVAGGWPVPGSLVTAATGVKWNVTDTLVLSGQILWTLNDRGLTAPATPTVALEYSLR
jgi:hypothetical protein